MDLSNSGIMNDERSNKDPDVIPEQAHLVILDIKLALCMSNNGKYTKHTRHIPIRMQF